MAEIKEKHDELLLSDAEIMATHNKERGLLESEREVARAQLDKADRYYEKYIAELLIIPE